MKKITFVFLSFFVAVLLPAQTFSWDITFLKGMERESIPISRIVRMETGETFLFTITPATNSFCYVIIYDSARKVFVLHDQPLRGGEEILFGPLRLDGTPGTETLYVIMSVEREVMLENLIQAHRNNPHSQQHSDNVHREIIRLQSTASELGEPASAFIPSGGTTRSTTQEYTTRFSGRSMYVRPIVIRH
ncbi:MAG: DUF4384 domain-containing protein [Treponema sp.]|nr:DUF4384 domain-containing protein [Treponema sp.]